MSEETAVILKPEVVSAGQLQRVDDFMPLFTVAQAVNRKQMVNEFIGTVLNEGPDYGKLPGGRAVFHANFTKSVCNAMGWAGFQPGQQSIQFEGELAATHAELQPRDGELSKWCIDFAATEVRGFEGLRLELENKKGKGHRYELRFEVHFVDLTACRYLEEFITHAGAAKSVLTINYTPAAEQSELVDMDTPTLDMERGAATAEDND